ncbi:hypothetical protein [Streptococcus orisratti]|uniref:hypothetical protein n=1 Tax=Streptococcus orisratti TaxID=114652 RepID=UPI002943C0CF|nr:hypothetical protein [Streptococcus orisratti]
MTKNANDILVDYEGLCGQLTDVLRVLESASQESEPQSNAMLHTAYHALCHLVDFHNEQTVQYRKEITR